MSHVTRDDDVTAGDTGCSSAASLFALDRFPLTYNIEPGSFSSENALIVHVQSGRWRLITVSPVHFAIIPRGV